MTTLDDDLPERFRQRVQARGCTAEQVADLAARLEAFKALHLAPSGYQTTPYHNLLSILGAEPIADFMIDRPDELMHVVARLRELTGAGAHNTFFTLGLPNIAGRFAREPQVFLELATIAGTESIGAFPALKGQVMSQWFEQCAQAYLAFVREVAELLGQRAGLALNVLYNDSLARCLGRDPARYVELLKAIKTLDDDPWKTVFQCCFATEALRDAFVELFDRNITQEAFAHAVLLEQAARTGPTAVAKKPAKRTRKSPPRG